MNDQVDFFRATAMRSYLTALEQGGLGPDDVEFVDLPVTESFITASSESQRGQLFGAHANRSIQAAEIFALIRGEVDAISLRAAGGADMLALLGAHVVVDIGSLPERFTRVNNTTPVVLTVSGGLLEQRPDLVARYLAVVLHAAKWAKDHPLETRRIVALEDGIGEEWVDVAHPGLHAALGLTLSEDHLAAIDSQKQFLIDQGIIEDDFDLGDWVAHEPLAEATRLLASGAFAERWSLSSR